MVFKLKLFFPKSFIFNFTCQNGESSILNDYMGQTKSMIKMIESCQFCFVCLVHLIRFLTEIIISVSYRNK